MAKRAPNVPSAARPQRITSLATDRSTPSPDDTLTPGARGDSGESGPALGETPPADDVPVELQVIFGENLRAARVRSRLNQRQLAARTGLPQQYLSQIEQGQQNVTLKTVQLLAKVLGQDVSAMLRRSERTPEKK